MFFFANSETQMRKREGKFIAEEIKVFFTPCLGSDRSFSGCFSQSDESTVDVKRSVKIKKTERGWKFHGKFVVVVAVCARNLG